MLSINIYLESTRLCYYTRIYMYQEKLDIHSTNWKPTNKPENVNKNPPHSDNKHEDQQTNRPNTDPYK